ncbi:hypothetical protein FBBAL38_11709 [Flavobacteria bacterium BAL38]|nr:hypothetical protein FBBAL38_11709 [Flavobacteria bacterium BAL38]
MKNKCLFLLLFFLIFLQNYAQNQPLLQKQKLDEFRSLFVQNVNLKIESLSYYKNINFTIDECDIKIETIDYENSNEKSVTVIFPISGAKLKKNGELLYKTEVIKEIIENKITKIITINLYENSNYIGLLLKLKNKEQRKIIREKLKELSRYCKLEN